MTTRAEWVRRVRRWRASGETAREFGARERLNPSTLRWWSSELRRSAGGQARFVEVVAGDAPAPSASGFVEVILADDLRIRVSGAFDPVVLRRAVAALRSR
jgi:hypothetical protein